MITGQPVANSTLQRIWDEVMGTAEVATRKAEIATFNAVRYNIYLRRHHNIE